MRDFFADVSEQGITIVQSTGYESMNGSFQIFVRKKRSNP